MREPAVAAASLNELVADEGLRVPGHIAVVMDGNGRWAQQRGLPRLAGHLEGRKATKRFIQASRDLGVQAVSLYAFSTENWSRSQDEVAGLMALMEASLREELRELDESNVVVRASGRLGELPQALQDTLAAGRAATADNTGLRLNLCINYGGRAEIVDAARSVAAAVVAGELTSSALDEAAFARHLYAPELPDVELLLRPGGEMRVSNFLLWEIAYAELVVLDVLWPDFQDEHLLEAVRIFSARHRRFGGLPESGS
jgi:undecaprenyl diphosphate synthase